MSGPAKPLPDPEDPLTAPYWAAAKESVLVIQKCAGCGYLRWPPTPLCPECQSGDAQWAQTAATGELWSYATYHRALDKAFHDEVPYTIGLIQLDAGPRIIGTVLAPAEEMRIGRRVKGVFDAVTPDVTMIRWELQPGD